jgi:ABC-type branched-subunit amino acid transport system ATPase component
MTLAFGLLASSMAVLFPDAFGGRAGRAVVEPLDTNFAFLDASNPNRPFVGLYWVGFALLMVCLYLCWNLVHSRWGRAFQAIRESEQAARAAGVPTYWSKVSAFALSAGFVALGGALAAQTNLQVTMADGTAVIGRSFELVIFAFFGGLGTLAGPVVGAFGFTLGLGVEVGGESIGERLGEWETLFLGVLIIGVTVLVPQGVVGFLGHRVPSRWQRRAPSQRDGSGPLDLHPGPVETDSVLLELRGISRSFGGVVALSRVDLEVRAGSIHALIGPNGSGKSTLVNVVTGFDRPDSGRVLVAGRDVTGRAAHRGTRMGVARTFQTCQTWRRMSVLDNVQVGAHAQARGGLVRSLLLPATLRRDEARQRDRAWSLVEFVGLASRAHDLAGSLPFVDQRRLEIARALASGPDLLILDEPAAGMHPAEVAELIALISAIRDAGVTVLLIEHHMEVVMEISDRVSVLEFGRKIAEGGPTDVAASPAVIEAYLGTRSAVASVRARSRPQEVPEREPTVPLLSVRGLHARYGAATALDQVDLDVFDREVVALIGANGAGKTTTLKAISGVSELLMTVGGEVTFAGQRIDGRSAQRIARLGLAHVPEGRRIFADSTVEENLLLGAYLRRDDRVQADLDDLFDRFPALATRRHQLAGLLSGGEQQMLAIARALAGEPRFLLLDEPSLGLAPILVDQVFEIVRSLADEGVPILVVEQMALRALAIADRAYILESGMITASGSASELLQDSEVRTAYLGGAAASRPGSTVTTQ